MATGSESKSTNAAPESGGARDELAICRTHLANERTLLAYIRTGLTLIVAGVSFLKFFGSLLLDVIGWIFVPLGIVAFLLGGISYSRSRRNIAPTNPQNGVEPR